ncbi:MAG: tetratricopeptide repeat protein, partial [Acidobacteria bacterium]|nr:tetratricopeptide repeat protein [Acidobacteriota bacterium]
MNKNENKQPDYRYPGVRPFDDNDIDPFLFFGRDKEKEILLHKTLADDLVVLYAKSGLGKTSLINAGLNQALRKRGFIPLMVRLNDPKVEPVQRVYGRIKELASLKKLEVEIGKEATLWEYFKTTYFWSDTNKILKPVLILDHFEEFFSFYSNSSREDFTRQLAAVIDNKMPDPVRKSLKSSDPFPPDGNPPNLKIIISIREDYLGHLYEMSRIIPDILHHCFRLLPLTREQAKEAIKKPTHQSENIPAASFEFSNDAMEMMLDFLCKRTEFNKVIITDEVESAQLQLLCQHYEEKARDRAKIENRHIIIETTDIDGEEGMQKVLRQFYDKQIDQLNPDDEKESARKLCEDGLISITDRRLSLEEDEILRKFNVSRELLLQMIDRRLLRSEPRVGSYYYELTHDTLVAPIRESQKERTSLLDSIKILYKEASYLKKKSNYKEAIQKYKTILEIDKTYSDAYLELGQIYHDIYRYGEAIETYNLAIANGINNAIIHCQLGNVLYDDAKIDEAIQNYEAAIKIDRKLSMPYERLGDIFKNKDNFRKAIEYYRIALKFDQIKAEIYKKLTISHIKNNEPEIAAEVFEMAIKVNPGNVDIYDQIADAFKKKKFYIHLEKITDKAFESESQNPSHYLTFGNNYAELEKYDKAINSYNEAITLYPNYTLAYSNKGYVLNKLGQYEEAVKILKDAIDLNPEDSQAYNNIGIALRKLKRYDEMWEKFQNAIANDPNNFITYINRGRIYEKMGKQEDALKDYRIASDLDPRNFYIYYKLGLSYVDFKKYKK